MKGISTGNLKGGSVSIACNKLLGILLITCASALAAELLQAPEKPNIVFILADDVSRNTWGAYGSKDCKAPNIDRLALEGIRFDRAYCAVAMYSPFRQELYSSRSPWHRRHAQSITGQTRNKEHYPLSPGGGHKVTKEKI
jgi:N-sulfoglucosamine sulfohydrolase